jgi:DNA gyrase subunit A
MVITDNGTLVRTRVNEVSVIGRNTQGVRLIRTSDDEHVVALQRIDEVEESTEFEGESTEGEVINQDDASLEHNLEGSSAGNLEDNTEQSAQQANEDDEQE